MRRILFVFKENRQDPCLQALKRWLPRTGHAIRQFEFTGAERGRFECINGAPRFEAALRDWRPDLVFDWIGYLNEEEVHWCHAHGAKVLRALNGFTSYNVGFIRSQPKTFELLRAVDWYFVPHAPHVSVLREHGVNAYEMPFFYDPAEYRPLAPPLRLFDIGAWDGFFAGGVAVAWGWNRKALIERLGKEFRICLLADINPKLDGVSWYGAITAPLVVNWMMNRSRVVLGSDFLPSVDSYHKMQDDIVLKYDVEYTIRSRVFSVMGSGRAFMVERHPEIERFFEDGKDIVLWSTLDEAADRMRFLIANPVERERIARAGHEKVRRLHTAEVRLHEMLNVVKASS